MQADALILGQELANNSATTKRARAAQDNIAKTYSKRLEDFANIYDALDSVDYNLLGDKEKAKYRRMQLDRITAALIAEPNTNKDAYIELIASFDENQKQWERMVKNPNTTPLLDDFAQVGITSTDVFNYLTKKSMSPKRTVDEYNKMYQKAADDVLTKAEEYVKNIRSISK